MGEWKKVVLSMLWLWLLSAAVAAEPAGAAGRLKVIATLFPQYDFARQIAQDKANIQLLLPPGAESHSFEPTPADMRDIAAADVFIYTGEHMEPWAKRLADSAAASGVRIVDASARSEIKREEHTKHDGNHDDGQQNGHTEEHGHDGHNHAIDPHIWLDPIMARDMARTVGEALAEADIGNAEFYRKNTDALCEALQQLDTEIAKRISGLPRRLLVFGDRFAFGYFFTRYGLESASPYKFCAAGAEPGLRAAIDTIALIKREKITYIFVEAMTTSRMADTISGETGVTILHVESLHNPPREKQAGGITYLSAMRENVDAFSKGLE